MKVEITIDVDVDDLGCAVEFYCEGIGLNLVELEKNWARAELGMV